MRLAQDGMSALELFFDGDTRWRNSLTTKDAATMASANRRRLVLGSSENGGRGRAERGEAH